MFLILSKPSGKQIVVNMDHVQSFWEVHHSEKDSSDRFYGVAAEYYKKIRTCLYLPTHAVEDASGDEDYLYVMESVDSILDALRPDS